MKKVLSTIVAAAFAMGMSAAVTPHFGIEAGYDHADRYVRSDAEGVETGKQKNLSLDGFHIGGNVQLDFMDGKHIPSLVLGLNYQMVASNHYGEKASDAKKEKDDVIKYMKDANGKNISYLNLLSVHSLQVPIRFQYAYAFGDCRVMAFTGPQIRLHVAERDETKATCKIDGKKCGEQYVSDYISGTGYAVYWENGEKTKTQYDRKDKKYREPWFDMAWGFGVGFGWKNLSINLSYDLGMMNMLTKAEKDGIKDINKALDKNYKYIINDDVLAVTIGYRIK